MVATKIQTWRELLLKEIDDDKVHCNLVNVWNSLGDSEKTFVSTIQKNKTKIEYDSL